MERFWMLSNSMTILTRNTPRTVSYWVFNITMLVNSDLKNSLVLLHIQQYHVTILTRNIPRTVCYWVFNNTVLVKSDLKNSLEFSDPM